MSLPWLDESDPNVAPNEFDQFPQGEVVVNGIHSFITVDESGVPLYKERDGRPYTMIRLRLLDGSEGPPMSCTPGEIPMLVAAFAGEAALQYLPKDRGSVGYLLMAAELANCTASELAGRIPVKQTAYVGKKGYVRNMSGMHLPTTTFFRFVVDDIRNLDGTTDPLHFTLHEAFKQEVLNVRFRVVSDMAGNPTMYDGATASVLMENPFAGTREVDLEGGLTATLPVMKVNQNKSRPKSVSRFKNFAKVFAPEIEQHEWISDATRSPYGTNEAANPIVVVAGLIKANPRIGIAKLSISQKSTRNPVRLDLNDFVPLDGIVPSGNPAPVAATSRTNLKELYRAIEDYVPGAFVPNSNPPVFSPTGVEWAKTKMLPIWEILGLPAEHRLADLTEDQASMLLGSMLTDLGWPKSKPQTTGIADTSDF